MRKRATACLIAVLLAAAFFASPALADGGVTMLIVNDVDVFGCPDPLDVLGDGTVSFDK